MVPPTFAERIESVRVGVRLAIVCAFIGLLPALAVAGGLGIAPALAIVGLVTFAAGIARRGGGRAPLEPWVWAVLAFALWALVTSLWSRYPLPEGMGVLGANPVKLVFGLLLYTVAAGGILFSAHRKPRLLQHLTLAAVVLAVGLGTVDFATHHGLSFALDPLGDGEDPKRKMGDAEMNAGHALTVALPLLPAAIIGIWRVGESYGRAVQWAASGLLAFSFLIAVFTSQLWVVLLGALICAGAMGMAALTPKGGVVSAFGGAAALLIGAPLVGRIAAGLSDATKSGLPFSWEHRVESWAYVTERVFERPFFGHGFDAVRTMDATMQMRGHEMSLVSLHPHNAGLHVWVETGAVGVGLAVVALILLARRALDWCGADRARAMAVSGLTAAIAVIASVSYGVWQEWWWATVFAACALTPVLLREA